MMDHIAVKGQSGTFAAYIARPKTSPAPAVVVLHEVFGVNAVTFGRSSRFGRLERLRPGRRFGRAESAVEKA
jgi:dienelactone hydrolase